jgi:hypothetical protein
MRHELDLLALILAGAYLGELGSIEQRAVVVGSGNRGAENRIEQVGLAPEAAVDGLNGDIRVRGDGLDGRDRVPRILE